MQKEPDLMIPDHLCLPDRAGVVATPNERDILSAIWNKQGLTRAMLVNQMEITQQSVHRLLTGLADRGLLVFGPMMPPAFKGKPSPKILLNPRFACSLGVSVDTDTVGVAVMDFAGGHSARRLATAGLSMDETLSRIDREISRQLKTMQFSRNDVLGMGLAISGFAMGDTRYNPPEPLAEWANVPLGPLASKRFSTTVWTENGANTAALCESMFGIGRQSRDFAYLSFNHGFGAGIISDGNLLRGAFSNAGEVSGIFTPEESPQRPTLSYLIKCLKQAGSTCRDIEDLPDYIGLETPGVEAWLNSVSPHMSRVVNVLAGTVDPEFIVLGGQIPTTLAQLLIDRVKLHRDLRHGTSRQMPQLRVSELGKEASAIGAACMPLKELAFRGNLIGR